MSDKHNSSWKMKKKHWFLLLFLYIVYLLIGAAVFMIMESKREQKTREDLLKLRIEVNEFLHSDICANSTGELIDLIVEISKASGIEFYREHISANSTSEEEDPWVWSYYNSFFFAFTVITTIGYGHMAPGTWQGRVFTIFYALIGIPLNGILLATLGEFFAAVLVDVHKKSKFEKPTQNKKKKWLTSPRKISLWTEVLFYLIPGFIIFIFIPAVGFVVLEDWTFVEGVYYAFVTLTTIGFGDLVARGRKVGGWIWMYNAFVIAWIMFGLGYLIMILSFIGRAYQSKRLISFEKKFRQGLKSTTQKISQGVTREAKDFRRLINTIQMLKVKPVYANHGDRRANALEHDLSGDQGRPRSKSASAGRLLDDEKIKQQQGNLQRGHSSRRRKSDAELIDIDKVKTFENYQTMEAEQPVHVLLHLASTLVHGDSDMDARNREISRRPTPEIRAVDVETGQRLDDSFGEDDQETLGLWSDKPKTGTGLQLVKALATRIASEDDNPTCHCSLPVRASSRASNVSQGEHYDMDDHHDHVGEAKMRSNVTLHDLLSATNIIMEADASVWERKVKEKTLKASATTLSPFHADTRDSIARQVHRLTSMAHFPYSRCSHKSSIWKCGLTTEEASEQKAKRAAFHLASGQSAERMQPEPQASPSCPRHRILRSISEPSGHRTRVRQSSVGIDDVPEIDDERHPRVSFQIANP
ncbi:unnamed protein product [Notodromas monacha]|uniref:Potassium channel domain-containing protein n=1 Tax=Notodromas monacha TaxID=399045 RepID=A0A7R9G9B8_9CRUS|nr:unnamed protein product [Notodromas monacha]CAG0913027.1 unnamed protein product [Notodromas monacha]